MVQREQLYSLNYYKRNTYMGSEGKMNYRIHKVEESQEEMKASESNGEEQPGAIPKLEGICWRGPYIFDKTPEEQKHYKRFPYSEEGMIELTAWLNQQHDVIEAKD